MTKHWLLALVLAAGCDVCPVNTVDTQKFASVADFHDDIVACANRSDCNQLCIDVFQLGAEDSLQSCAIAKLVPLGATVHVVYDEAQTCGDDGDYVVSGDDGEGGGGSTGDCTDDGTCSPPPDDGCSDGSCDPPPNDPDPQPGDGSTDDGGDTGGGDTGGGDTGGGGDDGGDDGGWFVSKPAHHGSITQPDRSISHPAK